MFKIYNKLKCRRGSTGEQSIYLMFTVLLIMIFIVLTITIMGAIAVVNKANTMATEIIRIAEIKGHTGINADIERIKQASGLTDATVTFSADYLSGTNRVQLGGRMEVVVKTTTIIGVGKIAQMKVPIKAKAVGISENYWK